MQKYILFTNPTKTVLSHITPLLFPKELNNKVLAYMPCDGWAESNQELQYTNYQANLAKENNSEFIAIDNSKNNAKEEIKKLESANILLITGGNTFTLLHKLRSNNLDNAIKKFVKKDDFIVAGWSAGALILTPSIALATSENNTNITDLTGLNLVKFEVMPHFNEFEKDRLLLYLKNAKNEVRTIAEDAYLLI